MFIPFEIITASIWSHLKACTNESTLVFLAFVYIRFFSLHRRWTYCATQIKRHCSEHDLCAPFEKWHTLRAIEKWLSDGSRLTIYLSFKCHRQSVASCPLFNDFNKFARTSLWLPSLLCCGFCKSQTRINKEICCFFRSPHCLFFDIQLSAIHHVLLFNLNPRERSGNKSRIGCLNPIRWSNFAGLDSLNRI